LANPVSRLQRCLGIATCHISPGLTYPFAAATALLLCGSQITWDRIQQDEI
jgi:hypothetical protein